MVLLKVDTFLDIPKTSKNQRIFQSKHLNQTRTTLQNWPPQKKLDVFCNQNIGISRDFFREFSSPKKWPKEQIKLTYFPIKTSKSNGTQKTTFLTFWAKSAILSKTIAKTLKKGVTKPINKNTFLSFLTLKPYPPNPQILTPTLQNRPPQK